MEKLKKSKKIILRIGHFYKCHDKNLDLTFVGQYVGKVDGLECCICHKGQNSYAFNLYYVVSPSLLDYETLSYGKEHLPDVLFRLVDLKTGEGSESVYLSDGTPFVKGKSDKK